MRQIVLDTETTGLEATQGHRIIEIGCVELVNRKLTGNHYHCYINPEREIDQGAIEVHGITNDFLLDKPVFAQIAQDFMDFVEGAELVIHNAPFDIGFLNVELAKLGSTMPPMARSMDDLAWPSKFEKSPKLSAPVTKTDRNNARPIAINTAPR